MMIKVLETFHDASNKSRYCSHIAKAKSLHDNLTTPEVMLNVMNTSLKAIYSLELSIDLIVESIEDQELLLKESRDARRKGLVPVEVVDRAEFCVSKSNKDLHNLIADAEERFNTHSEIIMYI